MLIAKSIKTEKKHQKDETVQVNKADELHKTKERKTLELEMRVGT